MPSAISAQEAKETATPAGAGRRMRARLPRLPALSPAVRLMIVGGILVVAIACYLLLFIRGSFAFSFDRRLTMLGAMTIAAFTQGVGTVIFHTVTSNRILSPSIMGFDSLYMLMQTLMVFFFGGAALAQTEGIPKLLAQTALMVVFATILYRWLFSGRFGSLFLLLLVGVVFGMAFDSLSTFVQRLLDPTDYDLLSTRLFGRMSNVEPGYLPIAAGICVVIAVLVWRRRHRLDTLLLGRETATSLGVAYKRELTLMLVVIALLIALSTALVGPLTFFGFVVAILSYQFAGTHRHAFVLPMAFLVGLVTLVAGQFVLQHIFYASGLLSIIIEFAGGITFLILLLRKGTL